MKIFDVFKTKVIVGFFLQTNSGLGAMAESIIDISGNERWKERLRKELGFFTNLPVKLFYENEWRMPEINRPEDVYVQNELVKIVGNMAIQLDELQVADSVVTKFTQRDIEILRLPTSGRVILFQVISASSKKLGKLL